MRIYLVFCAACCTGASVAVRSGTVRPSTGGKVAACVSSHTATARATVGPIHSQRSAANETGRKAAERSGTVHDSPITSWEEGVALVAAASRQRASAATACNDNSSRSHLIVRIILRKMASQTRDSPPGTYVSGGAMGVVLERPLSTVTICDLAGNENVRESRVSAQELAEARHVNSSLSALTDVMHALMRREPFVPFRNHALTKFLEPGMTGNARVLSIVTATAVPTHRDHTYHSLR